MIVIGLPESVQAIVHSDFNVCKTLFLKDKKFTCFDLEICRKLSTVFALEHLVE